MSTKRALLLKINFFRTLPQVRGSCPSLNSVTSIAFANSLSTATERSYFQNPNGFSGENSTQNEQNTGGYYGYNQNQIVSRHVSDGNNLDRGNNRELERIGDGSHGGGSVRVGQNQNPPGFWGNSGVELQQNSIGQSGEFGNGYHGGSPRNEFRHNPVGQNGDVNSYAGNSGDLRQNSVGYNANARELQQNSNGFYGNSMNIQNSYSYQREKHVEVQQNPSGFYQQSSSESRETVKGHYGEDSGHFHQGLSGYNTRSTGMSQQSPISNYYSGNNGLSQQLPSTYSVGSSGTSQQITSSHSTSKIGAYEQSLSGYPGLNAGSSDGYLKGNVGGYQLNPNGHYKANVGQYQHNVDESLNRVVVPHVLNTSEPDGEQVGRGEGSPCSGSIEEFDAFCNEGKVKEAVEVLKELEQKGVSVTLPRYLVLMNACGDAGALKEAKSIHEHLMGSASPLEVSSYNKILEMYGKCGSMDDAYMVFNQMPQKNFTSWDTMITWLAKNGRGEDAIELFTQFKDTGLKPDSQMFIGVFSACSVVGDMNEGMLHFESMSKNYGIVPSMEHYVSIVDMLGSNGYLDEALEFIEKMPMEPSVDVWETLMTHCRVYGNTELGDRCAELVQLLDPSRLNDQLKAGLIPVKASDLAKEKEKKKLSAQNLLEVRSRVHEYRAGDTSHPEKDRIYGLLRGMREQMKEAGYVAEVKFVLHDIDQEGKEEALLAHSERLAVAHGLMSSPARSPIRIIKNLRVCGDCHSALKIISKLVGRELIIRDAKRFHHFKDGLCSCRDYW